MCDDVHWTHTHPFLRQIHTNTISHTFRLQCVQQPVTATVFIVRLLRFLFNYFSFNNTAANDLPKQKRKMKTKNFVMSLNFSKRKHSTRSIPTFFVNDFENFRGKGDAIMDGSRSNMSGFCTFERKLSFAVAIGRKRIPQNDLDLLLFFYFVIFAVWHSFGVS